MLTSLDQHKDTVKGLHLDLSQSNVTSACIPKLLDSINSCKSLISIGLDMGDGEGITADSLNEVMTAITTGEHQLASLALGFHNSQVLSDNEFNNIFGAIVSKKDTLKMLRLNFSNTTLTAQSLEIMVYCLSELSLDHLELFLGGNTCVDDAFLMKLGEVI